MHKPYRLLLIALAVTAAPLLGVDPARAQESDQFIVAVLPFASSDDGKSKDLQKKVIAEMNELGGYTLVEAEKVNEAVGDAGLRPGASIPDAKSFEIARKVGAKIVARGTLENRGGKWVVEATFVDVPTRNEQELPEVAQGDIEELGQELVEVFNNRNQANKHIIFGLDYVRSENWERAITNFQKALEYDPNLALAYYQMGDVYLKQGQVDQALGALQKAIQIDPSYINAYYQIGEAYLEKGDTTAARNFFEQLVQKSQNDCDVQIAYGYVMTSELKAVEKGVAAFEKAKQLCPEDPRPYQYLALALPEDRRDEKIENFKRYLDLSEGKATDPEALGYLFGLYFQEERYEEAKATIDQALAGDPENAQLLLYAGQVRAKLEQHDEAIAFYNKALEINPDFDVAYLGRALSHQAKGDNQAYLQDLQKAGRGVPPEVLGSQAVGEAHRLLRRGRVGPALEALNRARALGGDHCAIAYYLGDAYYQMGSAAQGEDKPLASNQRSIDLFRTAINHLQGACGRYSSPAGTLTNNANQYIARGELIIKKQSQGAR